MLRMVNLLMALSLGVHREQLEHLMGLTWPRPFLLRPLDARFLTIFACGGEGEFQQMFRSVENARVRRRWV